MAFQTQKSPAESFFITALTAWSIGGVGTRYAGQVRVKYRLHTGAHRGVAQLPCGIMRAAAQVAMHGWILIGNIFSQMRE
ncbi:hypothetical protein [Burkholderia gladioli]|uniref:hypothetical protein n=1 Tax=Burkholderia gladioli TaxID=28095 RepID=UPI000CFED198|nr:hypothetical protein [Burkholderia gladioli]PRG51627.1 hypothetical protein C6V06_18300 [Burkholderia gladioli]